MKIKGIWKKRFFTKYEVFNLLFLERMTTISSGCISSMKLTGSLKCGLYDNFLLNFIETLTRYSFCNIKNELYRNLNKRLGGNVSMRTSAAKPPHHPFHIFLFFSFSSPPFISCLYIFFLFFLSFLIFFS